MEDTNPQDTLQMLAAILLSDVRDVCRTTQRAADRIVGGMDSITDTFIDVVKMKIHEHCSARNGYLSVDDIIKVLDEFKGQSLFEGVGSCETLESFLREKSRGKQVLLKRVTVKFKSVLRQGIPKRVPDKFGYIVSFLAALEQLLNCDDVLRDVDNPIESPKGVFASVTDGLYYKSHEVVKEHGNTTLMILIHTDDAETCDALKSKANKHSIRPFYWVLGNIHPKNRSTLKAINLLAIVKSSVAKAYGNDPFLEGFVLAMKLLGTEGVNFKIHDVVRRFWAVLGPAAGDNPGLANLGGLKETHFAKRPCRMCMVTSGCLCDYFREPKQLLRNLKEHTMHLREIRRFQSNKKSKKNKNIEEIPDVEDSYVVDEDDEIILGKYTDHKNPSINFGVNGPTVLQSAPGWDVTKCLPQDILHLLAEGVCDLLCRLLLREACFPTDQAKKVLDIKDLNNIIQNHCDFGHLNVYRPSPIEKKHILGKKLKQSATQMLLLLRVMPHIILPYVSAEKMQLLHNLIAIVDQSMSYVLTFVDVRKLEDKIEEFLYSFKRIYPEVKTLKLHCLLHLGTQTILLGPPRQNACFRYEAMHGEFTAIADIVRTKKNIALSTAKRILSKRNAAIMKSLESGKFLYDGDTYHQVEILKINALPDDCTLENFPNLTTESSVCRVGKYCSHSSSWKNEVIILVKKEPSNVVFGTIVSIYVVDDEPVFVYQELKTTYKKELMAFSIDGSSQERKCIQFSQLESPSPVARLSLHLPGTKVYKAFVIIENCFDA